MEPTAGLYAVAKKKKSLFLTGIEPRSSKIVSITSFFVTGKLGMSVMSQL
jgi:hypothetical protein